MLCAPEGIRTPTHKIRNLALYPVKLQAHLRRREDLNLCESCDPLGFRDRPNKPLLHASLLILN